MEQAPPELLGVVDKPIRQLNVPNIFSTSVEPHLLHLNLSVSRGSRVIDKQRQDCEQKLAVGYSEQKLAMLKKELRRLIVKF